jgi:hypothetical protein
MGLLQRIDVYTRTARTFYDLNRWVNLRIGVIGALFSSALAAYLVYFQQQTAENTGFSLNMAGIYIPFRPSCSIF